VLSGTSHEGNERSPNPEKKKTLGEREKGSLKKEESPLGGGLYHPPFCYKEGKYGASCLRGSRKIPLSNSTNCCVGGCRGHSHMVAQ